MLGFPRDAVILPVLASSFVARFDGLSKLAQQRGIDVLPYVVPSLIYPVYSGRLGHSARGHPCRLR